MSDLQVQINNKSLEMEPVVRPLINAITIDGKQLVAAEIKGIPYVGRPVYYKKMEYKKDLILVRFKSIS